MKSDNIKKPGKTGGVYYCKSTNRDTVFKTAINCMRRGYGGIFKRTILKP